MEGMTTRGWLRAILVICGGIAGGWFAGPWNRAVIMLPRPGDALCVLEVPQGVETGAQSFTLTQPVEHFYVTLQVRPSGEKMNLSFEGPGARCNMSLSSDTRFGCGSGAAGDRFTVTVRKSPAQKVTVVVDNRERGITGHQRFGSGLICFVLLSGALSLFTRRRPASPWHVAARRTFAWSTAALLLIFCYLLLHEGGHALGAMITGRYELRNSDFFGLRGGPHSGLNVSLPVEPWGRALESYSGPITPALAGWALFAFWRSKKGRRFRDLRPTAGACLAALAALLVFPQIIVAPLQMAGYFSDGDWTGFINNVPGPRLLVNSLLTLTVLISLFVFVRTLFELWRLRKKLPAPMGRKEVC